MRLAEDRTVSGGGPEAKDVKAELVRLRTETARLWKAEKEWQLEREILRRAAAYFHRR
ncbi:hypothetical protein AB0D12_33935 [Streptomyces sp. NPDC048479]|uniref:hypothetical protein n=1 Tax=Streptomyces sp. NPDC048479 TaxID=3154725 RepID=UPI00342EBF4B